MCITQVLLISKKLKTYELEQRILGILEESSYQFEVLRKLCKFK